MLNPTSHKDCNDKFDFTKELSSLLKRYSVNKEIQDLHNVDILSDLIVEFLENLKENTTRTEGIIDTAINFNDLQKSLLKADERDHLFREVS